MKTSTAAKAISLLWMGAMGGAACAFFMQALLARKLGPANYGEFSAIYAIVLMLSPIAAFGVQGLWLMLFAEEGGAERRWLPASLKFSTLTSVLAITLIFGWAKFGYNNVTATTILLLFVPHVVGQAAIELVSGKLQLEERFLSLALWQTAPHLARLGTVIIAVVLGGDIGNAENVAVIYGFIGLVIVIIGISQLSQMTSSRFKLKGHVNAKTNNCISSRLTEVVSVLAVAKQSWAFGIGALFYFIYLQSNTVLLYYLGVSAEIVGQYNTALTIMTAVYLFPSVVYQKFMLPKIQRWTISDRARLYMAHKRGIVLMAASGVGGALCTWLVAPYMILLLFGERYMGAVTLLNFLVFCIPIRFIATCLGAALSTRRNIRRKVFYMGCAAVANVAASFMLIPIWGAKGAIVGTALGELVLLLLYQYSCAKYVFSKNLKSIHNYSV